MDVEDDTESFIQAAVDALEGAKRLLQKICKPPKRSDTMFPEEAVIAARGLETYVSESVMTIKKSYKDNEMKSGKFFMATLAADPAMINRIQRFTLSLMNRVMNLQDFLDEPATLKPHSVQALGSEIEKYCTTILQFADKSSLDSQGGVLMQKSGGRPNGTSLVDSTKETAPIFPKSETPCSISWQSQLGSPVSPIGLPGSPENLYQFSDGSPSGSSNMLHQRNALSTSKSQTEGRRLSFISVLSNSSSREHMQTIHSQLLIATEEVQRHLEKNERFLARRRQSKVKFQEEFQALSPTWSSRPSSDGEGNNGVLALASTLKLPGFGMNISDGIEALKRESSRTDIQDGLMLANEPNHLTPSTSTFSAHCAMSHDSSFYRYGGFCEGAKLALKGEKSYKVIKRPEGSKLNAVYEEIGEDAPTLQYVGAYIATVTARCLKCSYEVDWATFRRNKLCDEYDHLGLRYKQSFLSKCHLKVKSMKESVFACVFCVDDMKTPEVHDATVFFSTAQLMRHIAMRHKPIHQVDGLKIGHGTHADQDCDLVFKNEEIKPDPITRLCPYINSLPTAHAIQAHHPKSGSKFHPQDPIGNPTLQFAAGAQIAGITFPAEFRGRWCSGYHDCSKGHFPTDTVHISPPSKSDIIMNSRSSLCATAMWDHKPKDTSAGWLVFSRKEKITHIEYPFAEFWCWSGRNSGGRFGFFPREFVVVDENLKRNGPEMVKGGGEQVPRSSGLGGVFSGFQNQFGAKRSREKEKRSSKR